LLVIIALEALSIIYVIRFHHVRGRRRMFCLHRIGKPKAQ